MPPDQVIDTVDLYFLKARQRRLSLKFLSWFVLHENIQTDTHDSIEDARSTLLLYKKYIDFEEEGSFDKTLDDIYKAGRQYVSAQNRGFPSRVVYLSISELEATSSGGRRRVSYDNPANLDGHTRLCSACIYWGRQSTTSCAVCAKRVSQQSHSVPYPRILRIVGVELSAQLEKPAVNSEQRRGTQGM